MMNSDQPLGIEKTLRKIHGWLGIFVLPFVIMIGLTGIYLNHPNGIFPLMPNGTYDETLMDVWQEPVQANQDSARNIAISVWPDEGIISTEEAPYHGRDAFIFEKTSGSVIVVKATGHYWVKSRMFRNTYDPNGVLVNKKRYWDNILKVLHTRGWFNNAFGTWLADIVGGAMVVFGCTGFYMFLAPRLRRRANRRVRNGLHSQRHTPRPKRVRIKK